MKTFYSTLITLLLLGYSFQSFAQSTSEKEKRNLVFQKDDPSNMFHLYNVNGSVTVEAYSGNEIQIEVHKRYEGKNSDIEKAKEDLSIVYKEEGNDIYVYVDSPGLKVKKNKDRTLQFKYDNWWNDKDYDYEFTFSVKVPKNLAIDISTINGGFVSIEGVEADVRAKNINGDIELLNISSTTYAKTINGDIDITYKDQPEADSYYKTINGDIDVKFPGDFSADVNAEIMHGDLYTDFAQTKRLPARVEQIKLAEKSNSAKYKINSVQPIRFGKGGPEHEFEVLNGNIYIRQRKS